VYKFDNDMRPIKLESAVSPLSGEYLEKPGLLRAALAKEAELTRNVPGYHGTRPLPEHESGVLGRVENTASDAAGPPIHDPRVRSLIKLMTDRKLIEAATSPDPASAAANPAPTPAWFNPALEDQPPRPSTNKDPVLVIIRHGQTEYNKLGGSRGLTRPGFDPRVVARILRQPEDAS
jgi:hypothetical protein